MNRTMRDSTGVLVELSPELIAQARVQISMLTQSNDHGVSYSVLLGPVLPNTTCVWNRTVLFGKDAPHRAGGAAFVHAAREQERIASWCRTVATSNSER